MEPVGLPPIVTKQEIIKKINELEKEIKLLKILISKSAPPLVSKQTAPPLV